jgi:hypothetical protein
MPPHSTVMNVRPSFHQYNYGSTQRGDNRGVAAHGEATRPIFRAHNETGRKAIYVNRPMTVGIVEMPLLNAVFDHSEKPEFAYGMFGARGTCWSGTIDARCTRAPIFLPTSGG